MYANVSNDSHSIYLVTAEMGEPGSPAYHYIVFRDHKGQDRVEMHGVPLPRPGGSTKRALRGVMAPPSESGLPHEHFRTTCETAIFNGPVDEYLQKMACAVDAISFINKQNLNFCPDDENGDSPNSIAHTLIKAMGLTFPEDAALFWAPGQDRILLPHNWRSAYG